jgi:hypothetical protein
MVYWYWSHSLLYEGGHWVLWLGFLRHETIWAGGCSIKALQLTDEMRFKEAMLIRSHSWRSRAGSETSYSDLLIHTMNGYWTSSLCQHCARPPRPCRNWLFRNIFKSCHFHWSTRFRFRHCSFLNSSLNTFCALGPVRGSGGVKGVFACRGH